MEGEGGGEGGENWIEMYSDYTTYSVSVYTTIFCQIRGQVA